MAVDLLPTLMVPLVEVGSTSKGWGKAPELMHGSAEFEVLNSFAQGNLKLQVKYCLRERCGGAGRG